MRCFFFDPATITGNTLHITGQEARHIASVLRLAAGVKLKLYDGSGGIIHGEITRISSQDIAVQILAQTTVENDSAPLILAQALLKGKKMDFLIQKATELGVDTFIPVATKFCEKRIHDYQRQHTRWQRIILEACKQCQRPVPMHLVPPTSLDQLRVPDCANLIMPWENETSQPLTAQLIKPDSPTLLLIGPEGGFHEEEIHSAHTTGFTTISLGSRILRAETAALAVTAIIQHINHHLDPVSA